MAQYENIYLKILNTGNVLKGTELPKYDPGCHSSNLDEGTVPKLSFHGSSGWGTMMPHSPKLSRLQSQPHTWHAIERLLEGDTPAGPLPGLQCAPVQQVPWHSSLCEHDRLGTTCNPPGRPLGFLISCFSVRPLPYPR